jgi:hypothetical protein
MSGYSELNCRREKLLSGIITDISLMSTVDSTIDFGLNTSPAMDSIASKIFSTKNFHSEEEAMQL